MTDRQERPGADEVEFTLLGPGYGESAVVHLGADDWIVVDSFRPKGSGGSIPAAIGYLEAMGSDPAEAVKLIVATHWHDDHIRGMAELVDRCGEAVFCCSAALRREEFLAVVGALGNREVSVTGSGVSEMHAVFSRPGSGPGRREFALANRRLFHRGECEVWSLSPDASVFERFLHGMTGLMPDVGEAKRRISSLSPNETTVVLWIRVGDIALLLGGDMERSGWSVIVEDPSRPEGKASVFKLPHHGSKNAHHERVWDRMLESRPVAVLAPWCRGGRILPRRADVQRILGSGAEAYATVTNSAMSRAVRRRDPAVARTIHESGIELRRVPSSLSGIRMRRRLGGRAGWTVKKLGYGCRLPDFLGDGRKR